MSAQRREEVAPAMSLVSCESFKDALDVLTDQACGSISELVITHPSHPEGSQHDERRYLCEVIGELRRRRHTLPDNIVHIRSAALAGDRCMPADEVDQASNNDQGSPSMLPVRHLRLVNGIIDSTALQVLISLVHRHASIALLCITANRIQPSEPLCMQRLAQAVNMSTLRVLELSNNPIGTRSIVQFLNHLDTPSLTQLTLSMTMSRANLERDQAQNSLWTSGDQSWRGEEAALVWRKEVVAVGDSLAALIAGNRNGGYAPRLERLALNGNDLGWKAVRTIVNAVLQGNTCLTQLELFASISPEDSDDDDDGEEAREADRPARRSSISALLSGNRVRSHSHHEQGQQAQEDGSLARDNWRFRLGRHLWSNRVEGLGVKDAARHLLRTVRVLSCKCRDGPPGSNSTFPFVRLPPEIRQKVILELDERRLLSVKQMERIISFASDPATLGYGCKSAELGLSSVALQQIHKETAIPTTTFTSVDQQDYGLLPHHRWSWTAMVRDFSLPRDWPATILDETRRIADTEEGLGGGGPDGLGGVTLDQKGPDRSRRRWLQEQSGLHAFWEATGTYRAD